MSTRKFLKSQIKTARKLVKNLAPHERKAIQEAIHGKK